MMPSRRVVVIGASSGGIEALRTVVSGLTPQFDAPICVVLHMAPDSPGMLGAILSGAGPLKAVMAEDGERLIEHHIYVAPPDHHLLLEPGTLRVTRGPKENRFRPAIDPLFRSAAQVYGPGAIGIVMTGRMDDGTAGLAAIKQLGGIAIVQDPKEALWPSMPASALRHVAVDYCLPLSGIAPLLTDILAEPVVGRAEAMPEELNVEVKIAKAENALEAGLGQIAEPSSFACPECHGVLLRLKRASPERFRCHTGHAFSADSLVGALNDDIEGALWSAVRALEEGALLLEELSRHTRDHHDAATAEQLAAQGAESRRQSEAVRQILNARRQFESAS